MILRKKIELIVSYKIKTINLFWLKTEQFDNSTHQPFDKPNQLSFIKTQTNAIFLQKIEKWASKKEAFEWH